MTRVLHLMTQDGQPYGSARICCERCGVQVLYRTDVPPWTDRRDLYDSPPDGYVRCSGPEAVVAEVMES